MTLVDLDGRFRSVVVCEDIRDELGNKKSLMGVIGGDIRVAELPAAVRFAVYMEYVPGPTTPGQRLKMEFWLMQGDSQLARGAFDVLIPKEKSINFVLPAGVVAFDKPSTLRLLVAIDGGSQQEVVNKKVELEQPTSTSGP